MEIDELEEIRKTGVNKAFTSVSLSRGIADHDFNGKVPGHLTAEVHIPKGTPGAYIDGHGANGVEAEFLLDKGTKFKVIQSKDKMILEVQNE
ncbi:hypothetical protein OfM2_20280 [Lactovum odontotermitis]